MKRYNFWMLISEKELFLETTSNTAQFHKILSETSGLKSQRNV